MNTCMNMMEEADQLTTMVVNCFKKKKFDNKFLVSLATVALEKYMVACLISKGNLPNGHTLSFLVNEMVKYIKIPLADIDMLEKIDDKIQLCSIEIVDPFVPTDEEMDSILKTLLHIRDRVKEELLFMLNNK